MTTEWKEKAVGVTTTDGRAYWREVLDAGGVTGIPRWTRNPVRGIAECEQVLPDRLVAELRLLGDELAVPVRFDAARRARQGPRCAVR